MASKVVKGLAIGVVVATLPVLFTKANQMRARRMPDAFEAIERVYHSRFGDIHYIRKGAGDSLVFIHGLEPGTSSYEWRANFAPLTEHFRVFNLDLLGYGNSEKPALSYTTDLFSDMLIGFIEDVVKDYANVVVSPASIPFVLQALEKKPVLFQKVCLISPLMDKHAGERLPFTGKLSEKILNLPVIGNTMYHLSTQKPALKKQLQSKYHRDIVNREMQDRAFHSSLSGGPNAYKAPMAYRSGKLKENYESILHSIQHPLLLVTGEYSSVPANRYKDFSFADRQSQAITLEKCGSHPHEECPGEFNSWLVQEFSGLRDLHVKDISSGMHARA
ncbi:alpha/beta fold hydrolase [Aneurinibacillus sp. Ricciae_BoGa-3]|uniref:alpha/beta fold hydrolase n=1 Tax=Aneurinibacillus sp. Ricciae_BoGa-3 TaxID=3022697 RepID=UPI00233FDA72|nr:alpha/beta fold hydrolase [Aneurinibacillus sp. Ricciae_BoGa-3]WCK53686.1 alpha/beta fold hydrolase [Aneurinibacillus sp. Ricciae_BoGa-3]